MSDLKITIQDIDELKAHISDAVVRDVQDKVGPLIGEIKAALAKVPVLEKDIKDLKANQRKALVGFAALCTGVTLLFNQIKLWVFNHLHLS